MKNCCRFVFYMISLTVLMSIVEEVSRKIARARRRKPIKLRMRHHQVISMPLFSYQTSFSTKQRAKNRSVIVKFKIAPETELGFCRIALCRAEKKIEILLPSGQVNFIFHMPHLNITCAKGTQYLIIYCSI